LRTIDKADGFLVALRRASGFLLIPIGVSAINSPTRVAGGEPVVRARRLEAGGPTVGGRVGSSGTALGSDAGSA
jgi:hypothetical protein